MKRRSMLAPLALAVCAAVTAQAQTAAKQWTGEPGIVENAMVEKSASTSTVGARATVTSSLSAFGGFELNQTATVYILVRGNSLGSLGITQGYLDAPHVRLFNASGQDLITQSGFNGFNDCDPSSSTDAPVVSYYAARGIAPSSRDTCIAATFNPGAYTFSVTPSVQNVNNALRSSGNSGPSAGEILFEVKLGP